MLLSKVWGRRDREGGGNVFTVSKEAADIQPPYCATLISDVLSDQKSFQRLVRPRGNRSQQDRWIHL